MRRSTPLRARSGCAWMVAGSGDRYMRILGIVALGAALASCASSGTQFEWANASKVVVGMTENELVATMGGRPNAVATKADNTQVWSWIYVSTSIVQVGSRRVSFVVKDGRVFSVPNLSAFTSPAVAAVAEENLQRSVPEAK
jgi:outer membrane protein assembly factor BamE (lipoprotein component of BamABCDE complex)